MSADLLVLSRDVIERSFHVGDCVDVVAEAYRVLARGEGELSPKYHWEFTAGRSAAFASAIDGFTGIKIATIRHGNPDRGLPRGISQVVLHRAETGEPLALLDGISITVMRTAAAAALGAKVLARPDSRVVTLFGPGVVGRASLVALGTVFDISRAYVVGISDAEATAFVGDHAGDYDFEVVASRGEEAVPASDIVVTLTPSTTPIVMDAWVRDGTHISAVGSDWKGKQELETAILARSRFVTDSRRQCLEIGEANVPHANGMFDAERIDAEIGEILVGARPARTSEAEVTVFDSSGISTQDLVTARWMYEEALARGVGTNVQL